MAHYVLIDPLYHKNIYIIENLPNNKIQLTFSSQFDALLKRCLSGITEARFDEMLLASQPVQTALSLGREPEDVKYLVTAHQLKLLRQKFPPTEALLAVIQESSARKNDARSLFSFCGDCDHIVRDLPVTEEKITVESTGALTSFFNIDIESKKNHYIWSRSGSPNRRSPSSVTATGDDSNSPVPIPMPTPAMSMR